MTRVAVFFVCLAVGLLLTGQERLALSALLIGDVLLIATLVVILIQRRPRR